LATTASRSEFVIWQTFVDAVSSEFADLGDAASAVRVAFRLIVAAALGGALGYERESKGKDAGLRTHMLVALGAAMFVLVPQQMGAGDADLARVMQGIVAGIGFLGAGAIVKGKPGEEVEGLTTAAGIWMTAAIGMAVGLGRETTAILSTIMALLVLVVVRYGERCLRSRRRNASKTPPLRPRSDD
jgi:putative Mg2+ transporter-C (MgtC) family protein